MKHSWFNFLAGRLGFHHCKYVRAYVRTYVCTYVHTYVLTCTKMYVHPCVRPSVRTWYVRTDSTRMDEAKGGGRGPVSGLSVRRLATPRQAGRPAGDPPSRAAGRSPASRPTSLRPTHLTVRNSKLFVFFVFLYYLVIFSIYAHNLNACPRLQVLYDFGFF